MPPLRIVLTDLLCSSLDIAITGNYIYPFLQSKGIKLPTTYKFAIGSMLGACAITYDKDGSQLDVSCGRHQWHFILIG
jgi:hypothetical protein